MVCDLNEIEKNKGEKAFYWALKEYLDDSCVVYWHREVFGREFDFCILIPEVGLCMVEVKGWHPSTVVDVPQGESILIQTKDGPVKQNPKSQSRAYRFDILNYIKNKLGKQPLVFDMVAYPFISTKVYKAKQMNKVSAPQFTFLADDFKDKHRFLGKLDQAASMSRTLGKDAFTPLLMKQVRQLFEPEMEWDASQDAPLQQPGNVTKKNWLTPCYSILSYIPAGDEKWKDKVHRLIQAYVRGVRIYHITNSPEVFRYVAQRLSECLKRKGLSWDRKGNLHIAPQKEEKIVSGPKQILLFNWQTVLVQELKKIPPIHLVDGKGTGDKKTENWLKILEQHDGLNLAQYRLEHASPGKNILVRAGAGTGKTYAMILRIAYLIYAERIPPADLANRIVMITFTNEAADNMRERLKACFQNYYLLTGQQEFYEMIGQVERMQISTIHSYAKKLIEKLGTLDGYGQNVKIVSGRYHRELILDEILEAYLQEKRRQDRNYLEKLALRIYQLREVLLQIIEKLDNKSINVAELRPEHFGTVDHVQELHQLIIHVLTKTEKAYHEKLLEENILYLGRLMVLLETLVKKYSDRLQQEATPDSKYLFIDEFQDTDDVQIDVLRQICEHVGYRLFVVGDVKQCIYRFRGAQEKAFDRLEWEKSADQWEQFSLQRNYRTDQRLLDLFQKRFVHWGESTELLLSFNPEEDALVSTQSYHADDVPSERFFRPIVIPSESQRMDHLFAEVSRCQEMIRNELRKGNHLSKEERTIAILVRENRQAEEVVHEGRKRNIHNIETSNGGILYQSPPAIEMAALLQALLYSGPVQLANLLETNFFHPSLDRAALYNLRVAHPNMAERRAKQKAYLLQLIDQTLASTASRGGYTSWEDVLKSLRISPPLQVVRKLYDQLQPGGKFEDRWQRDFYRLNVNLLFEKMVQGCGLDNLTLYKLTNFMVMNIRSRISEECRWPEQGEEGIRLLCITVHKSKGLEFGHVILPYADFSIERTKGGIDVTLEPGGRIGYKLRLENLNLKNCYYNDVREKTERKREETRLLYVAMTRAIRSFSWIEVESSPPGDSWQTLLKGGELK